MRPLDISLTHGEVLVSAIIGVKRHVDNLFSPSQQKYGLTDFEGWQRDIEGACGEAAFAKWCGRYWLGNDGDRKAPDVWRYEVRAVSRHDRCLLVHDDDHDDRPYVLVTGLSPNMRMRGWLWGYEAKKPEYLSDPIGGRPAYFVHPKYLRPMTEKPQWSEASP